MATKIEDTLVAHSRPITFTLYTREGANAAGKCDVVFAPPRAANNRKGCVQTRRRFHGQELHPKMKDTLVAHSRPITLTLYTRGGANAAGKCDVVVAPSRATNNRNGCVQTKWRFHCQELSPEMKDA